MLIGKPTNSHLYSPQDSISTTQTHTVNIGDADTIALMIDDTVTTSTYNWYKDGNFLTSTNVNQLLINNFTHSDTGIYNCQVTNSIATNLTLYSRTVTLRANCENAYYTLDTTLCIGESITVNGTIYNDGNLSGVETIVGGEWKGCDSTITINLTYRGTKPILTTCPSNIAATTALSTCTTPITWTEPTATDSCGNVVNYTSRTHTPNDNFGVGTTTVTYIYGTIPDTTICSFDITVTDNENPSYTSFPTDIMTNNDIDNCSAIVTWTPPTSLDNCGILSETVSHVIGSSFPIGTTTVTYDLSDLNNNTFSQSFDITVTDNQSSTIISQPNDTIVYTNANNCDAAVSWISPSLIDNCGVVNLFSQTHNSGDLFGTGTTTIAYTYNDGNGNTTIIDFDITVIDTIKPTFTNCLISPNDTIKSCYSMVSWTPPTASDNCGMASLTASHTPTTNFPIGSTDIYYIAEDINGNKDTCHFVVLVHAPVQTTLTTTSVSCKDGNDGTATTTVIAGTAPYTYNWNTTPSQTTATANNLIAGTYTVITTDIHGCSDTSITTVTEPTALTSSINQSTDVLCFGTNNGTATVTANGGIPIYNYVWDNNETIMTATALSAGWHYVTITDVNSCITLDSVLISEPLPLTNTKTTTNVSCFGNADGSAAVIANGGTSPYTYLWSNNQTTNTITGLIIGNYIVTITDVHGCLLMDTVTIQEPTMLQANYTIDSQPNCYGGFGSATALPLGGTPPYTYAWDNSETTQQAILLLGGAHQVTITDVNGCQVAASLLINQPSVPLFISLSIDGCSEIKKKPMYKYTSNPNHTL